MNVSIQKWGNSLAVRIPKAVAEQCGIENGSVVDLRQEGDSVILMPVRKGRYRLAELLKEITPENRHDEIETGEPVGRELW